jgi:hypothetical protein
MIYVQDYEKLMSRQPEGILFFSLRDSYAKHSVYLGSYISNDAFFIWSVGVGG